MSRKVFVLFGVTGEYSDRSEWPVRAFLSYDKASEVMVRCNAWADKIAKDSYRLWENVEKNPNPDDLNARVSYSGTEYGIYEIELDESEPAHE